jgi:hypothetical protein
MKSFILTYIENNKRRKTGTIFESLWVAKRFPSYHTIHRKGSGEEVHCFFADVLFFWVKQPLPPSAIRASVALYTFALSFPFFPLCLRCEEGPK